jgi:hypothetical protein
MSWRVGNMFKKLTMEKVIIEIGEDNLFSIYNEAGQLVEADFKTRSEAEKFAKDNGFIEVNAFFI